MGDNPVMASDLNNAVENADPDTETYLTLYDYAIPLLGLFVIVINFIVMLSSGLLIKKGVEPRYTYMFLGNLSMTDFITGLSVLFGQYYPKKYRNHHTCVIQIGMIVASTLSSAYSVGLIAIDRYLYIVCGLKYCRCLSLTKVKASIIVTWIIAIVIGFLPLTSWHGDTHHGKTCWFINVAPKPLVLVTVSVGLIPVLTVFVLYSIILYYAIKNINHIRKSIKTISETIEATNQLRMFKGTTELPIRMRRSRRKLSNCFIPNKFKAVKIVMFTTLSFVLTWSPYFIACVVYVGNECSDGDSRYMCQKLQLLIASPLAILGFANSLINPIIYAWWHTGFRTYIRKKITKIFKSK
ncbi:hypothetical protein GWI33_005553 [Rhynchophorus ferrugineus]|uniref:G-protein coupled receptors family 1 profile domain-containing protein n=1 Tax=Rhynchophorus ferrugineus TaxID=354439 RepID=A0A834MFX8_RHYFE|nr:hypothetical protein GWI33_005553 [Rhynchophorus ferrugineus]